MINLNTSATFFDAHKTHNCVVVANGVLGNYYISYYKNNRDVLIDRSNVRTQLDQPNYEINSKAWKI